MIEIKDKKECCGCEACMQRCPKICIAKIVDEEGFTYPQVDTSLCINCALCEAVCPVIHRGEPRAVRHTFAAKNPDLDIRLRSSSGGAFYLLAQEVIRAGGVVFGVRFDSEWRAVHAAAEDMEGVEAFMGSKYMQSSIGDSYNKVECYLRAERRVLFSGTSCQIAGLRRFLRRDYPNLLLVEILCHGVPSPMIWLDYVKSISSLPSEIGQIKFRDKVNGWKRYSMTFYHPLSSNAKPSMLYCKDFTQDSFMRGFLRDIYLRPACYACPSKGGRCGSDILLGDYWGIQRHHASLDDDKGVSLITVYNDKGKRAIDHLPLELIETPYDQALQGNPALERPAREPVKYRTLFWQEYERKGIVAIEDVCKKMAPSLLQRYLRKAKRITKKVINI